MRHPALPAKQSGKKERDRQSTRFFFSRERRCHQALKLALNSAFTSAFFNLILGKWAAQAGISAVSMGLLWRSTALATCCPDRRERERCNFWRCCNSPMWQANTWIPRHTRSAEGLWEEDDARHLAPASERKHGSMLRYTTQTPARDEAGVVLDARSLLPPPEPLRWCPQEHGPEAHPSRPAVAGATQHHGMFNPPLHSALNFFSVLFSPLFSMPCSSLQIHGISSSLH